MPSSYWPAGRAPRWWSTPGREREEFCMSRFVLSCTTCSTRIPGRDEISECFIHAPTAGYKAWGAQSQLFWWPGMTRWANIDFIMACAAQAGLERCTEVHRAAFPTESIEA